MSLLKTTFTLLCCTLIWTTASAQTEKGVWLAGGNLQFGNTLGDNSIFELQATPRAGYFLANNFALGATLGISHYGTDGLSNTGIGFGPFARYYVNTSKGILKPYFNAEVVYYSNKVKNSTESKFNSFLVRPGLGLAIFVSPNIALENQLTYQYRKIANTEGLGTSAFQFSVGFQIHFNTNK